MLHNACKREPNFSYIPHATTTRIEPDGVIYTDEAGNEHKISCDDVVLSAGVKPRMEEAMAFYGSAARFYLIGDCHQPGSIQSCTRSAFAAASQI